MIRCVLCTMPSPTIEKADKWLKRLDFHCVNDLLLFNSFKVSYQMSTLQHYSSATPLTTQSSKYFELSALQVDIIFEKQTRKFWMKTESMNWTNCYISVFTS